MTTTGTHPITTAPSFVLDPISVADATLLRDHGGDRYVADTKPGYPCRRCLRDAEIGEEMILVSHDPFTRDTPYRSASPIFLHRHGCERSDDLEPVPEQLAVRQLSVRAMDRQEMIVDAAVIDGAELAPTLAAMFEDPDVVSAHVHFAARGCWATRVARAATDPSAGPR